MNKLHQDLLGDFENKAAVLQFWKDTKGKEPIDQYMNLGDSMLSIDSPGGGSHHSQSPQRSGGSRQDDNPPSTQEASTSNPANPPPAVPVEDSMALVVSS